MRFSRISRPKRGIASLPEKIDLSSGLPVYAPGMAALITFLTSSAGGAFVGFLADLIASRRESAEARAIREHEERISERRQLVDMRKADAEIARAAPLTFVKEEATRRPMFLLFGPVVEYSRKRTFQKVPQSPRSRTISVICLLFAATYCLIALVYVLDAQSTFEAIDPMATPKKLNFLIFKFEWMPKDTFQLSGGGATLYLLSPISFMLTTYVTGKTFRRGR